MLFGLIKSKKDKERTQELKLAKIDAKVQKVEIRQGGKTDRTELKTAAKSIAYANGVDPDAAKWQVAGNVLGTAGNLVGLGMSKNNGGYYNQNQYGTTGYVPTTTMSQTKIGLIALGVVAFISAIVVAITRAGRK